MTLHPTVAAVTARIVEKSRATRADYIRRMDAARDSGTGRAKLSCANWAHAFAGQTIADKLTAMDGSKPNLGIVTAYNDMLSAHQPFERFPGVVREAVRQVGATAQVAGGTPAMCDGVTQGRPGMELSLFSRDVIAMSTAIALSHDMFDGALLLAPTNPPTIQAIVEMEDGARIYCLMTDCNPNRIEIGMPVEMTYRLFHEEGGFYNYYWKAHPAYGD